MWEGAGEGAGEDGGKEGEGVGEGVEVGWGGRYRRVLVPVSWLSVRYSWRSAVQQLSGSRPPDSCKRTQVELIGVEVGLESEVSLEP